MAGYKPGYYAENKEKYREYERQQRARMTPEQRAEKNLRSRAMKYGVTAEGVRAMYASQGGTCAGCSTPFSIEELCIDHHHESGLVRALLCQPCNRTLGAVRERPEVLESLARYIRFFEGILSAA